MASEDQDAWVGRVLGITMSAAPVAPTASAAPADARAIWRDAKDAVDSRIESLGAKLRATGDPDLIRIAERGLFSIGSGRTNVALNKAMIDYNAAAADKRAAAAAQLRQATASYRAALAGNEGVDLIDRNPFGVKVDLRASLTAALDQIEQTLA